MESNKKWSFVASLIVLLLSGSCQRGPEDDQTSSPGKTPSADVNSTSATRQDQPSPLGTESSAPSGNAANMDAGKRTTNAAGPVPGSRPSELDLNSGDLHGLVSYSDGHRQYADYESRLSKEVRRLGIPIPKERNWQPLSARYRLDLLHAADLLLDLLDEGNAIDQDRQSVLEKFMANMRTEGLPGAVGKAHELIQEFADQHGLKGPFQTWRTEDLRRRINARSATQPER